MTRHRDTIIAVRGPIRPHLTAMSSGSQLPTAATTLPWSWHRIVKFTTPFLLGRVNPKTASGRAAAHGCTTLLYTVVLYVSAEVQYTALQSSQCALCRACTLRCTARSVAPSWCPLPAGAEWAAAQLARPSGEPPDLGEYSWPQVTNHTRGPVVYQLLQAHGHHSLSYLISYVL